MTLHAPQIIFLFMMFLGIGISMARFGQQKTDCYDLTDVLIGPLIVIGLLYWGGFFG